MPWPRSRTRRRNPPRHDDLTTGNPLARPHTLLIDSEELESGEALDDKFRAMAADEIDCFRRDIVERTGDARAAETIIDQALLPQDNAPPKEMILRVHLVPALGHKRLDAIKSQDVQHLEGRPEHEGGEEGQQRAVGVERAVTQGGGVGRARANAVHGPAAAVPTSSTAFYDFDDYERLVETARLIQPRTHLIVLLWR